MGARGRKSAASLEVISLEGKSRVRPREGAPAEIAELFREIVSTMPASHFQKSDAPLIEAYAQAILLGREAYTRLQTDGQVLDGVGRISPWVTCLEKSHRSAVALSMRLRLAPQSRLGPKDAGRAAKQFSGRLPWEDE